MTAPIGDADLQAYLDDQLDTGGRIEVERWLQDHPEGRGRGDGRAGAAGRGAPVFGRGRLARCTGDGRNGARAATPAGSPLDRFAHPAWARGSGADWRRLVGARGAGPVRGPGRGSTSGAGVRGGGGRGLERDAAEARDRLSARGWHHVPAGAADRGAGAPADVGWRFGRARHRARALERRHRRAGSISRRRRPDGRACSPQRPAALPSRRPRSRARTG